MKLTDRVALVTGGSHGLGLAIARDLSAEGAAVALVARGGPKLDEAARSLGGRAIGIGADVTQETEVATAISRTVAELGRLDIVVLNAGTWQGAPIAETTEAQWDALLDLNLKGAFLTLKHAIPHLARERRGTVVGIASLGALVGQPGSAAYAASKWGLRGLLESAALELKPHRVRVSLVYPHNINSAGETYEAGTAERDAHLEPRDIASMVAWICTAPDHVAIGNVTVWPVHAGIKAQL